MKLHDLRKRDATDIIVERMRRINVWGESRYASFRKKNIRDNANAKGFWAQAVPLKL